MEIISGVQTGPRKVLVYGRHGMGKSSWAASAPNPLFLTMEEGTNDMDVDRTRLYPDLDSFRKDIRSIISGEVSLDKYDSLVVDSMDWMEKLVHADVVSTFEKPVESIAEIPYGRGYETALDIGRKLLAALSIIQRKYGVHIILIAHASVSKYDDPAGESYDRITPALHVNSKGKGFALEVLEWCDEVFYLTEKTFTRESDAGFNQKKVKAVGSGQMILHTRSQPAFDAKSRLHMPSEIPFPEGQGWAEYAKYFNTNKGE